MQRTSDAKRKLRARDWRAIALTIGKVAAQAHVSTDTIRYYEKEGLLAPVGKSENGYRFYDDDALRRLHFIKHAQHCGLSLWDIRELLDLRTRADSHCQDIRHFAGEKKVQLEQKIRDLHVMVQALGEMIDTCDKADGLLDACPMLAALEASTAGAGGRRSGPGTSARWEPEPHDVSRCPR
ncbi:heavy metal-responsive transcriptional regulator [Burkholderia cenocepacia]|jgi:MerR family Zn(II)-responsive transcriptional regulator of zntA|uniref:heavy metal-responsive transcriptional regulator n=1 Tax=Burkholderia cenocepacia TaxID=95486 RepID=UPI0009B51B49|nr:heavy metal-responsive transcriptional regulator [Burkholderia cenocepacia]